MQVTIGEAARHLGLSEHTVRRRVSNGQLAGSQVATPQGYTWRVEVDEVEPNPETNPGPAPEPTTGEAALLELVATLQGELSAKNGQIQQLHILLQQTQAALPAPKEKQWWRWW